MDVATAENLVRLPTRSATFGIDTRGSIDAVTGIHNGRNYLAVGQPAPLLSVRVDGKVHAPDRAVWNAPKQHLTLHFPTVDATAVIKAESKPTHVVFEVIDIHPVDRVELVLWGPYPTIIGGRIGEIVGVVRDNEFAVGIQALNAKTIGGSPARENDVAVGFSADDRGHYPNLPAELNKGQTFRGDTARATPFGSVLQAYCRRRDADRVIPNWGHDAYLAPAFSDGGVRGSRIALFGCVAANALTTLGEIEVAEGLPHPMLDGVWAKQSPASTASYLIVDFGENNIDRAIEMTRRAGLQYLYHSSPFASWGHFKLKPELFPNGWDGLRACVVKARKAGVHLGVHTLSNFITPSDAYVSPKPDPRLARIGDSALTAAVDASVREIPVAAPEYFSKETALNTVRVGEELIRFRAVSSTPPWRLLDCERGAWGTRAVPHEPGETVARLMDHSYQVFLSDAELSREIARNLARLFNHTGLRQISFDGLEGNWSTGLGQYGRTLFTKTFYDALRPELQEDLINDASNPGHFNWHINTRMNWGEPWYAGFRESQTLYRFKNQVLFERNLMPHMLGWFALRGDTSIEDVEWLLARAAGFNAGFALATSLASTAQLAADPDSADTAKRFGATTISLEAIRHWETARMAGAFPESIRAALRDNAREFHLRPAGEGGWDLFEVHVARFAHTANPGSATEFEFHNPASPQPLQWIVRSTAEEPVSGITLEVNGTPALTLGDQAIPPGGSAKYTGGSVAVIFDSNWKELARAPVDPGACRVKGGRQRTTIASPLPAGASLKVELRTLGAPTHVTRPHPTTQHSAE